MCVCTHVHANNHSCYVHLVSTDFLDLWIWASAALNRIRRFVFLTLNPKPLNPKP